ncbi:MAG: hypothetical protein ACI9KE_003974 [Polyangiales bacterium]|jgi:hypothetical protein
MRHSWLFAVSLALAVSAPAAADDDRISVQIRPVEGHAPWIYRLSVTSHDDQDVAFDRRLLRLEVHVDGVRRPHKCSHPDAPARSPESRAMSRGESHHEWIDLRMYCWGRALRALQTGNARITTRFGFKRRGRGRFVARRDGERRPAHDVAGPELSWTYLRAESTPGPVRLGLADQTSRGSVRFRPSLRAGNTRPHVYLRDDQYSFEVDGPNGHVSCVRQRLPIVPIPDRFRRLRSRQIRENLDADYYCPEGTFDDPGIYSVTPVLNLPHSGESWGIEALTGVYEGSPGIIRVRTRRYVLQNPDSLDSEEDTP